MSSFKTLDQFPTVGCSEAQAQLLMMLTFGELDARGGQVDEELMVAVKNDPICKIITHRVEVLGEGKLSPHLTALISYLAQGNPGHAIMLAHAVHMATPKDVESNLERFVHLFPDGFPSPESLSSCWANQKSGTGGNLIDLQQEWVR